MCYKNLHSFHTNCFTTFKLILSEIRLYNVKEKQMHLNLRNTYNTFFRVNQIFKIRSLSLDISYTYTRFEEHLYNHRSLCFHCYTENFSGGFYSIITLINEFSVPHWETSDFIFLFQVVLKKNMSLKIFYHPNII